MSSMTGVVVDRLFIVKSGDYHATMALDAGTMPLVSCGDTNNGVIGYFDIPREKTYSHCITVAYNGLPLTTKFHPYRFGAKDDVAVLKPRYAMRDSTLLYVAALLNRMSWRYSYGRKCFREKLRAVVLPVPIVAQGDEIRIDEEAVAGFFTGVYTDYLPKHLGSGIVNMPPLRWREFNITSVLTPQRGDFHSIAELSAGSYPTVSRVAYDNGIVGRHERPDGARLYPAGCVTVSTVGGDAFVQMNDFIATDNVIVCAPRLQMRASSLFFVAFMLNHQKWRYGYGRQCYLTKLRRVTIWLPVQANGTDIDEDAIETIVTQATYWSVAKRQLEASGVRATCDRP